jgi:DNA (cytosine-5)-methyltransferase 1
MTQKPTTAGHTDTVAARDGESRTETHPARETGLHGDGMRYLSVCSGIEAATVAWHPLGWQCAGVSEIERFPSAVLAHHYPDVPNFGDFTTIQPEMINGPINLLVGGTPCQSFSVAGLRGGMDDERGNLALEFCKLAGRLRPRWIVWENVPGVLSSNGGSDFGCFLRGMAEFGYLGAWRTLDAQYFGLAQRRKRVFAVFSLGDWRPAAAVLFEPESMRRDNPPRREAGEGVAPCVGSGAPYSRTGNARVETEALVAGAALLAAFGEYVSDGTASTVKGRDYKDATDLVPVAFGAQNSASQGLSDSEDVCPTLDKSKTPAVAFNMHKSGNDGSSMGVSEERTDCLLAKATSPFAVARGPMAVRRLTPRECERLQGFPDDYTQIPWRGKDAADCPDGPRYKALGNSMAVPVMHWIGQRIATMEANQ